MLNRGGEYALRSLALQPLNLFREAWYQVTAVLRRNTIFNIAAFILLEIFLSLLSDKLKSLWKTVGIGCLVSICIESTQYLTSKGQADIGDVICNTLGVSIGYGLFMAMLTLMSKFDRKPLRITGYLAPTCITP